MIGDVNVRKIRVGPLKFGLVELVLGIVISLSTIIGSLFTSILPTALWVLIGLLMGVSLSFLCILKNREVILEGLSLEIDRQGRWNRYLILASTLYIVGIECISYLAFGLIPVGWDTAQHLYMSRLILEGDFSTMLEMTGGSNFIPYLLVVIFSLFNVDLLFVARIFVTLLLSLLLLIVIKRIADRRFVSPSLSTLSVILTAVWISVYRLSADLHKTLISYLCLLTIAYIIDSKENNRKTKISMVLLSLCISFSQLEVSFFLSGVLALFLLWKWIVRSPDLRNIVRTWVLVTVPMIPAFLLAVNYSTRFIAVTITYEVPLFPPDYLNVSYALGSVLLPFAVSGIIFYLYDFVTNHSRLDFISFFVLVSILGIIVPSFFVAIPTLFRKMAPRLLYLIPVPIVISDSIRKINMTIQGIWLNRRILSLKPILSGGLTFVILVAAVNMPLMAVVHQHPFISDQSFTELQSLSRLNLQERVVFATFESATEYRDDGWVGAFIGNHYAWNGPIVYLLSGVAYPTLNDYDLSYSEKALVRLQEAGIEFPLLDPQIDIVTTESFYGPMTQRVSELRSEVADGVYLFNSEARSLLLQNYSISTKRPYDYSGPWKFYDYALLETQNPLGTEFISYPVLAPSEGNFSISIVYRDSSSSNSNVNVVLDGNRIGFLNQTNAFYYKMITFYLQFEEQGVHFLRFSSVQTDVPSYISIKYLFLVNMSNTTG